MRVSGKKQDGVYIYIFINNAPIPIYPQNIQVLLSEQNQPPPKHLSKLVNNNTTLNLNIISYFLNILDSPDVSTWYTTGGPITKTIKHLGLTKHRRRTVERTWLMVNSCQYMGVKSTGNVLQSILVYLTF